MNDNILKEKNEVEQELLSLDKRFSRIAGFRLLVFLVAVVLIFAGFGKHSFLLIVLGILFAVILIVVVAMNVRSSHNARLLNKKEKNKNA